MLSNQQLLTRSISIDPNPGDILNQLISLSKHLGEPANDYVLLAEGNTSAGIDAETFWVKASGAQLDGCTADQFIRIQTRPVLTLLDACDPDDEQIRQTLSDARVEGESDLRPSIETFLHAVCLELEKVNYVGHTHPTAINSITCSKSYQEALAGRIFPDEVVVCGAHPLLLAYVDPGLPLARVLRDELNRHVKAHGEPPKAVYLQNHGFMALGANVKQVQSITAMAVKSARTLIGTYALGGPNYLTSEQVKRINDRPDVHYRQRVLGHR